MSNLYPIKIDTNKRYCVDAQGQPFFIHGDTAWSLFTGISKDEAVHYLKTRAEQGFNSIIINLIEHKFNGPATRSGLLPFHNLQDLSTPNDAYFDHCEWVMGKIAEHGIQVFLAPIYLGYPTATADEGWYNEVIATGVDKCRAYGEYVGKRFAKFDNIVWMMGGDRNPGASLPHVNAIAAGIDSVDQHRHLFTAHTLPESCAAIEYASGGWLNLNNTYTYNIVHGKIHEDYRRQPVRPFFLMESTYEGEHNASAVQIRRQAYWALLGGACGQFFGNHPIWSMDMGWASAMHSRGSHDMMLLKRLVDARPWWKLVPDIERTVVVSGLGEFRGLDYCAAARANDGSFMIAYMPTARTITVDVEQITGPMQQAHWFNPSTGEVTFAGQAARFRRCFVEFVPPGDGDWVLVLDDATAQLPAAL